LNAYRRHEPPSLSTQSMDFNAKSELGEFSARVNSTEDLILRVANQVGRVTGSRNPPLLGLGVSAETYRTLGPR
jgi:hypothetical protein